MRRAGGGIDGFPVTVASGHWNSRRRRAAAESLASSTTDFGAADGRSRRANRRIYRADRPTARSRSPSASSSTTAALINCGGEAGVGQLPTRRTHWARRGSAIRRRHDIARPRPQPSDHRGTFAIPRAPDGQPWRLRLVRDPPTPGTFCRGRKRPFRRRKAPRFIAPSALERSLAPAAACQGWGIPDEPQGATADRPVRGGRAKVRR